MCIACSFQLAVATGDSAHSKALMNVNLNGKVHNQNNGCKIGRKKFRHLVSAALISSKEMYGVYMVCLFVCLFFFPRAC